MILKTRVRLRHPSMLIILYLIWDIYFRDSEESESEVIKPEVIKPEPNKPHDVTYRSSLSGDRWFNVDDWQFNIEYDGNIYDCNIQTHKVYKTNTCVEVNLFAYVVWKKHDEICFMLSNEPKINHPTNDEPKTVNTDNNTTVIESESDDDTPEWDYPHWMTRIDMDEYNDWELEINAKGGKYDANTRTHKVYKVDTHEEVNLFAYKNEDGWLRITKKKQYVNWVMKLYGDKTYWEKTISYK